MDHPALKANCDVAHLAAQKEILSLSWVKLAGRVGGVHLADNNTRDIEHRPVGEGVVDIGGLIELIARSGYDGYLGLDLFTAGSAVDSAFVESRSRLREMVLALGLQERCQL